MKRLFQDNPVYGIVFILVGVMFIGFSLFDPHIHLLTIFFSSASLLKDYIAFAGFVTAFLNVILVMSFVLIIMHINHISINGLTIAGLLTVMGFAYFGKNAYNIIWIFLGVYLYAKSQHLPFKQFFNVALFATAMAPLVTSGIGYGFIPLVIGHLLAIGYGFIIAPIASHAPRFHNGYTLYNIGFSGGVVALVVTSVLRLFKNDLKIEVLVSNDPKIHLVLMTTIIIISLFLIILGCLQKDFCLSDYKKIIQMSGHGSDFYMVVGHGVTYMNMGIIGLILLVFCLITGIPLNGASFGSIISVIGFGAYGKHPRNILPLILGVYLMIWLTQLPITPVTIITIIFVTGLAPITGDFGIIAGLVAGMLHYAMVSYTGPWQGGLNLYNNGFAGGFVAALVSSLALHLRANQKKQHITKEHEN